MGIHNIYFCSLTTELTLTYLSVSNISSEGIYSDPFFFFPQHQWVLTAHTHHLCSPFCSHDVPGSCGAMCCTEWMHFFMLQAALSTLSWSSGANRENSRGTDFGNQFHKTAAPSNLTLSTSRDGTSTASLGSCARASSDECLTHFLSSLSTTVVILRLYKTRFQT